ncbi:MAG: glycosyltransferase family 1 protein [Planctomycetia bacterium]|nr:glycosyltransferase family 1 protein [Planctomycetia bacterium]
MKAVVTGMIAAYPVGGVVWDYGQYLLGLERFGFEVFYLEDSGEPTYDPDRRVYDQDCSYGVAFLARELSELSPGLERRWHFRTPDGRTAGMSAAEFEKVVASAELFLNVSGGCLLRDAYMVCPRKVLIDTDPGRNHFVNFPREDAGRGWPGTHGFRGHDHFFTFAERLGKPDCPLPDFGLTWHPTRPLVVLDCWEPEPPGEQWTTVMGWDNFRKPLEYNGRQYRGKEPEFEGVEELPARVSAPLEVACGGDPPAMRWRGRGWSVIDSHAISRTVADYRHYVQRSRGEFGVAKNVYSATRCGWFSCRTICYLAAGRPAVVQDTGFAEFIPTGSGLFAFSDVEGAAAGLTAVEANYPAHQEAARDIAKRYFASDVVLKDMLQRIGLG